MARSAKALRRGVVRAVRDLSEFETIAPRPAPRSGVDALAWALSDLFSGAAPRLRAI